MIEEQQNLHPNKHTFNESKHGSAKKSPELADLIRQNINYQNDQTIKKTLMKQSMMKLSLDKDFKDLFGSYKKPENEDDPQEKAPQNFLEVTQQIKEICEWLQESDQYAGMAYMPLTFYTKFFHVLHQKIDTVAIIVTQYPLYNLAKMQNLNRLSKLKWAFLNSSLDQEDKVKILEMYELKKLKLLFVTPSMFKNETLIQFESELLVFCDFDQFRGESNFVNNIISRTKPGRVLGIFPTLLHKSMQDHESNNFHYINTPISNDFNFITLKCTKEEKQKTVLNYLNKSPVSIQKTLILINKRPEAAALAKKMNMDAKATVNLFDYVSYNELQTFNGNELFNKCDKIKEQEKILEALKKIRSVSEVVISTYSDILKFENFDLVVFYNFTDVKKFVECCPNAKNKLLLFDEDDYHNFRNSITADYLNNNTLQRHIVKIIEKQQKKDGQSKKRFYSDYVDDRILTNYSVSKQIIEKDEQKNIKINNFCKTNSITQKNFMRIIEGLVEIGMISINCRAIYEIQIDEDCLQWFRKKYPELTEVRKKVNVLDSAATLKTITVSLLEDFRRLGIRYRVSEEALQFRVMKNYEDINWSSFQTIVNKKLMETVNVFDYSLQILRECAYSSIELTRREKVLQRKETLLKFSLKDRKTQTIQTQQSLSESYHKSNLLTSEIEEYLRTSEEGVNDEHELVMLLQGVERSKMAKEKEEWIFGRYRKMKYQVLVEAVNKIFKNKKIKL